MLSHYNFGAVGADEVFEHFDRPGGALKIFFRLKGKIDSADSLTRERIPELDNRMNEVYKES